MGRKAVWGGSGVSGQQDALDEGDRRTHDLKPLRIERHGHKASPLRVKQVSGGRVAWIRRPLDQVPSLACPVRLHGNLRVGPIETCFGSSKEQGLAAGQELRPAVIDLPFLETSQRLRSA